MSAQTRPTPVRGLHPAQLALYQSLTPAQRTTYWGYLRSRQDLRAQAAHEARQYATDSSGKEVGYGR